MFDGNSNSDADTDADTKANALVTAIALLILRTGELKNALLLKHTVYNHTPPQTCYPSLTAVA